MDVEALVESIDLLQYISQFTDFEKKGREYFALSPLKEEKTPSFTVDPEQNVFYDFASGIGGGVLTFVKKYYKCSTQEAIKILADYKHIDPNTPITASKKMAATLVCKKFKPFKPNTKRQNVTKLPTNCMAKYETDRAKLSVWEKEEISHETMQEFDVKYDRFSDRIVYPIRDIDGNIVNIGGRTLDPCWKEKKLRKYTYFYQWGTLNVIYGLYEHLEEIRKCKEIILFEGAKSVLITHTWGIKNTGAILTSHLSPCQLKLLAKLGCRVVFALDKDVSVSHDTNIRKLSHYIPVSYIWDYRDLLNEKDSPVDQGKEVFNRLYNEKLILK